MSDYNCQIKFSLYRPGDYIIFVILKVASIKNNNCYISLENDYTIHIYTLLSLTLLTLYDLFSPINHSLLIQKIIA